MLVFPAVCVIMALGATQSQAVAGVGAFAVRYCTLVLPYALASVGCSALGGATAPFVLCGAWAALPPVCAYLHHCVRVESGELAFAIACFALPLVPLGMRNFPAMLALAAVTTPFMIATAATHAYGHIAVGCPVFSLCL